MKLQEAPKQIATKNGRGSTFRMVANIIPMGVSITATATFEMNADKINVTPYSIAKIITGSNPSPPPISVPTPIMKIPITSSRFVF